MTNVLYFVVQGSLLLGRKVDSVVKWCKYIVGARCSSVVRTFAHGAMGRRVDPSWGGPIELFLVPASAPRLVNQRPWYMSSCLWNDAYKKSLAANR